MFMIWKNIHVGIQIRNRFGVYQANQLTYAEPPGSFQDSTPSNWLKIKVLTVLKVSFTSNSVFFQPKADQTLGVRGPFHAAGTVAVGAGTCNNQFPAADVSEVMGGLLFSPHSCSLIRF